MSQPEPLIHNISDTARWAAVYRRRQETERPTRCSATRSRAPGGRARRTDPPQGMPFSNKTVWAWVTRTSLFDQFLTEQLQQGVDLVVNLAAGLDARPYRMALPASLQWVEVDLPEFLTYKEEVLAGEKPVV